MEISASSNPSTTDAGASLRCSACGASARDEYLYAVGAFSIHRCTACGLGRTLTPPGFDPTTIYTKEYFQGGQVDGYADYQGSRKHLAREFEHALKEMGRVGLSHGRLLEVGCAYGYFLDQARASFSVSGIELAEDAVAACVARGLDVVRQPDDAFFAQRAPFDAVVMLDVIEHLERPDDVLGDLHARLRPGGLLMLTTGDFGSLAARTMGRKWRLMTPPQHLWFFTVESIKALLARKGYRVVRVTHPTKQVPLSLIAFQLSRYVGMQGWLKGRSVPGAVPVNLFDAMRVFAERI